MTRQTRKHVKISHFKLKFNQTHFGCHQVPPSPPQRPISMKKPTQRFTNEKERQRHRFRCCTQRQSDLICITFVSAVAECSARWATRRPAATQKWWRQLRCKSFLLNYFNLQLFKFLKNLAPHRHFFIFFWKFKFGAKSINRVLIKIDKGFVFFFFEKWFIHWIVSALVPFLRACLRLFGSDGKFPLCRSLCLRRCDANLLPGDERSSSSIFCQVCPREICATQTAPNKRQVDTKAIPFRSTVKLWKFAAAQIIKWCIS